MACKAITAISVSSKLASQRYLQAANGHSIQGPPHSIKPDVYPASTFMCHHVPGPPKREGLVTRLAICHLVDTLSSRQAVQHTIVSDHLLAHREEQGAR